MFNVYFGHSLLASTTYVTYTRVQSRSMACMGCRGFRRNNPQPVGRRCATMFRQSTVERFPERFLSLTLYREPFHDGARDAAAGANTYSTPRKPCNLHLHFCARSLCLSRAHGLTTWRHVAKCVSCSMVEQHKKSKSDRVRCSF